MGAVSTCGAVPAHKPFAQGYKRRVAHRALRPADRRRKRRTAAVLSLAAIVAVAASGCGGASAVDRSKQVATTVEAFDQAATRGDFATICNRLFTPQARADAGGSQCASQLQSSSSSLAGTQLRLTHIALHGSRATATITAVKVGLPPADELLQLVPGRHGYLISAAGTPAGE
jgi:hypothetical protein